MSLSVSVLLALGVVLPARLQVVHDACPHGARIADIGCDHGQLSAALALSGRASTVFACDMSSEALRKTARTLELAKVRDNCVHLRAGSGLGCILVDDDVDSAAMAGLGIPRMVKILREGAGTLATIHTLVLQPITPHLAQMSLLRASLRRSGFNIITERFTSSDARPYVTLTAVREDSASSWSAAVALLGAAPPVQDQDYCTFLRQQRERLTSQLHGQHRARHRVAEARQCRRLEAQIALLDSILTV
eukprot:CAMPEP_0115836614 /NCGR_PEP_ID=MMETSP0287-20121206/4797_1 /TAXON_ID=412157 /ORGANISM="Chrysochromulina rotalis, Strain UIO044" /LENGTH=247 /DNA_ID=CAMNT_0003290101 /DNA_START=17 /DNA_END=760 /DNA_ORIENTATION=+